MWVAVAVSIAVVLAIVAFLVWDFLDRRGDKRVF
jgi:hypothetical protein